MQADADVLQERQRLQDDWKVWQAGKNEYIALLDGFKKTMYGARYAESEYTMQKTTVEQVIDLREEPYNTR